MKEKKVDYKKRIYTSILLLIVAVVAATAATAAWFTISDSTRVKTMGMEITGGANLRFDLDAHASFDEYEKTLLFSDIAARVQSEKGYNMKEVPLEPVTTTDAETFTWQNGTVVDSASGAYVEFTLHFMANRDLYVHLTTADSSTGGDGTAVSSSNSALPQAMRISFTADSKTMVYCAGMGATTTKYGEFTLFGLASKDSIVYDNTDTLFYLEANVDKPVTVRIWLEGTDSSCTDDLKKADYSIQLRFVGTDENGQELDGRENND